MASESRERRKVRLTPPPRAGSAPDARVIPETEWRPGHVEASKGGSNLLRWVTVLAFVALAGTAVAVFVLLPDWAEERRGQAAALTTSSSEEAPIGAPSDMSDVSDVSDVSDPAAAEPAQREASAQLASLESPRREETPTPEPRKPAEAPDHSQPTPPAVTPPPPPTPFAPRTEEKAEEPPDAAFVQAMSDGLAALDRADYAAARDAFQEALRLQPGAPQASDGLARADAHLRRLKIAEHREKAASLEDSEDWRGAMARYEAVLEIDPTVLFAQEGYVRALERAEIDESLRQHIAHPDRLSTPAVLQEAFTLMGRAAEIEPAGPLHRGRVAQLRRLVELYSTPVRAALKSDNLTEVVVYKVGRLGVFGERVLDLRPGSYTVVGSRQGYRDVRRQLVIEPGKAPEPLVVRCEEKI